MKVAILTLTGENNYGNKLQNYAVQYQLKKLDCQPVTIRVSEKNYLISCLEALIMWLFSPILRGRRNKILRKIAFLKFNKNINQNFHKTIFEKDSKVIKKLKKFDKIIYGSDQIWNPEMKSFNRIFLGFYSDKEKNIALSASFGCEKIDHQYFELFRKGLLNFNSISVREMEGRKLVKEFSTLNAVVLPDPTLTVPVKDWIKLEKNVKIPKKYILIYFLGKKPENDISKIKLEKNIQIIDCDISQPYGPSEFLYLIHNASMVYTDSYHASVFSILYGIACRIYDRKDDYSEMRSRTRNLIELLEVKAEVEDNYIKIFPDKCKNNIQMKINGESKRFMNYLYNSLNN